MAWVEVGIQIYLYCFTLASKRGSFSFTLPASTFLTRDFCTSASEAAASPPTSTSAEGNPSAKLAAAVEGTLDFDRKPWQRRKGTFLHIIEFDSCVSSWRLKGVAHVPRGATP